MRPAVCGWQLACGSCFCYCGCGAVMLPALEIILMIVILFWDFFFSSSTCFKKRKRKINPQLLINSLVKNVTFPQVSKIRFVALCAPCSNLTALPEIFTYQLSKPWPVLMKCLHWSSSLCTSLHNCTCKLCSALYLPVRQERASVVTQLWHV